MSRTILSIVFLPSLSLIGISSALWAPAVAGPPVRTETASYGLAPTRPLKPSLPSHQVHWHAASKYAASKYEDVYSKPGVNVESELLSDLADGRLDQTTLLDAALIIGGASDRSTMRRCRARWNAFKTLVGHNVGAGADSLDAAMQVFRFMHDEILVGDYFEDCNAIDRALLGGDYNCVTATILFRCLTRECRVDVRAESLPGHVRCRILPHNVPVETTDPSWYPDEVAGDASGRVLTDVELLAKLYYNRGLAELNRGNFAASLTATELSWQLDHQHDAARDNVATVINNWALDLSGRSNFTEALSLLKRGRQLVPGHPILYANESHIRDAWNRNRNASAAGR